MPADDPTERHRTRLDELGAAILNGRGVLPPEARQAAARNDRVPELFADYVDTIHRHAYRVTDRMVRELEEAGAGDDEVFEISVAAAYGAARERLEVGLRAKAKFAMIRLMSGDPTLDVVKTLSFRPAFFGNPFNELAEEVMRGPSEWTVGERELFAAFVSERNRCEF